MLTVETRMPTDPAEPNLPPQDNSAAGENICPQCSGSGRLDGQPCPTCDGTGKVIEGIGGG